MLRSQHSRAPDEFEKVIAMEPSASHDDSRRRDDAPFVVASSAAECSGGGQNSRVSESCTAGFDQLGSTPRTASGLHETHVSGEQKPDPAVRTVLASIIVSGDADAARNGRCDIMSPAQPTSYAESSSKEEADNTRVAAPTGKSVEKRATKSWHQLAEETALAER